MYSMGLGHDLRYCKYVELSQQLNKYIYMYCFQQYNN